MLSKLLLSGIELVSHLPGRKNKFQMMKLPRVHLAVNVAGLLGSLASGVGLFIVNNPNAVIGAFPAKDSMLVALAISAIATFLPTKHDVPVPSAAAQESVGTSTDPTKSGN